MSAVCFALCCWSDRCLLRLPYLAVKQIVKGLWHQGVVFGIGPADAHVKQLELQRHGVHQAATQML